MTDQNLLNSAHAAHQSGDLQRAEQMYLNIINEGNNAAVRTNAQQLLGSLYSNAGHLDAAEQYMIASLAADSNQPHVRNNLGICYKRQGNFQQAMNNFNLAISLQQDYLAAYKNLTSLFLDYELNTQALAIVDIALGLHPDDIGLQQQRALAKQGLNRFTEALQIFQKLHAQAPQNHLVSHNLAVCLRLNDRPEESLEVLEKLATNPELVSYQLLQNMGNAHNDLGRLDEATSCFQQVIESVPNYVPAHDNLKNLLWSVGESEQFVASYETVIASGTSSPELQQSYVESLLTGGQPDTALAFFESKKSVLNADEPLVMDFKARCYLAKKDTAAAIDLHTKVCTGNNVPTPYWIDYAITLIHAGENELAANILEQVCNQEPTNQMALAHLSLCWRILGDARSERLNNYDLVGEYEIPTPAGFSNLAEFNQALNHYLTELHTSKHHPLEQTLQQGTQTHGNLFSRDHELLNLLRSSLQAAIQEHAAKMKKLETPYPGFSAARDFEFSASWSVRLNNEGFHSQHIHPMGWLSSAYYVDLPDEINASEPESDEGRAGWIKFGEPNIACLPPLEAQHVVKPEAGKLVLFPSYMWHGTIPFKSDQNRTTVVFDALPKQS